MSRFALISLIVTLISTAVSFSAYAVASVTLVWNPSPGTNVAGYDVYYGVASRTYTNKVNVGNTTNATISGLIEGTTYYFAVTAYDSNGLESDYSNEMSYTVPTAPGNAAPTINAIANVTINEDAPLQTINLSGITSGSSNEVQTLTVTASSSNPGLIPNPSVSYTSPNTTGSLSFAPAATFFGTATITVTVNDGGASNNITTTTFIVTVNSVNDVPTLNALSNLTINENATQQTVNLSGITSGAPNENQTLTVTATSSNPTLIPNPTVTYTSPNTTGSIAFTPAVNGFGASTITVTVNDGGASNNIVTRTFTVTVNAVNQQPTLNAIANVTVSENAPQQTVNLSGITSGATNENQTLTVTASSSSPGIIPNPTVSYTSPNTTGSLTFTPVPNVFGTSTITVTVNDGQAQNNTVTRTFTVTVNGVNQAPTLDPVASVTINENASAQTVNLTGITSGATNEIQSLTVTASSSNPSLIPNPTVTYTSANTTGTLNFTPAQYGSGTANITVTVNDGAASNNIVTRTFTVTVNAVNQPPTLNSNPNITINENAPQQTVNLSGITSGAPNENQTLTVTAASSNPSLIPNPTVTYTSPNTTGTLNFTPAQYGFGAATITVTINDGGTSNNIITRTFTVTVNAVNQQPTLNAIADVTINENAPQQTVNLAGIGSGAPNENQTLTVTATSSNPGLIPNPTVAYTSPNSTGSVSFTPAVNGFGTSVITVTMNDGGTSNNIVTRTFNVTVNAVNQQPTLTQIANVTVTENSGQQTINLSGITSGATNEIQTLTVTASSGNTGVVPNPTVNYTSPNTTGTLTFTPVANASGTATISVTVNDGQSQNNTITRTFTVTVNQVNAQPTLNPISALTLNKNAGQQTVNLSGISSGASNEIQTLTVTASSSDTTIVPNPTVTYTSPNATGSLTFTPVANAFGTATISVTVNDGQTTNNTITRTFNVTVNDPPTISTIADQGTSTNTPAGPFAFTIGDSETPASNLILTGVSSATNVVANSDIVFSGSASNRFVTVTPVSGATGVANITITVNDGIATASSSFNLNVILNQPRPPHLLVVTNGSGSVASSAPLDPNAIGKTYTVTAIPDAGQEFAGWTGSVTSSSPTISFTVAADTQVHANFVKSTFSAEKGAYNGLFYEDEQVEQNSSGCFSVHTTPRGTYTGKLQIGATRYSLKGQFDASGQATNHVTGKNGTALTVELRIGSGPQADKIYGRVTDGNWVANLAGDKNIFNSSLNPAPDQGLYTVVIPGVTNEDSLPAGDGYASVRVTPSGSVQMAGMLADGTKFSQSAPLSKDGEWPLYVSLYKGNGSVLSWMNFENRTNDDINGSLNWIKLASAGGQFYPAGFTRQYDAVGSTFVKTAGSPALNLTQGNLTFSGGNLTSDITNSIAFGPGNHVTDADNSTLKLNVNSRGTFRGTVDLGLGAKSQFSGVVFQKLNVANGLMLGSNESSEVLISE